MTLYTGGSERMRVDTGGNVGIGITAPTAKLDLYDATLPVYLQQTRGSVVQLAGPTGTAVTSPGQVGTSSNSPFRIITNNTDRVRIDETGNVGIGTSYPSKKLEVYASVNSLQIESIVRNDQTGTGVAAIGFNVSGSAASEVSSTKAGIGLVRSSPNGVGSLAFYNNSNSSTSGDFTTVDERMRIAANGFVGINTTSPASLLTVAGSGVAIQATGAGETRIYATNSTASVGAQMGAETYTAYVGSYTNHPFVIRANDTEAIRALASGNVGIGNTAPTDKLSVTGNTYVSGNITAGSYHIRSIATGISAAGTTQATATAITKEINVVSTVQTGIPANNGVVLPTATAGMVIIINNTTANTLFVYPAAGGIINSLAANAAFSHVTLASLQYYATSATQWYTVGATYS
jgi:hypothetical protein